MISMELASKCSICSFQLVRTSEIQFTLFEGVQVGEGICDQLGRQTHYCDLWYSRLQTSGQFRGV